MVRQDSEKSESEKVRKYEGEEWRVQSSEWGVQSSE
jgi:hypothetical protein